MVMVCVVWVCGEMKDECVDGSKGDGRDPNFKSFCVCVCVCVFVRVSVGTCTRV